MQSSGKYKTKQRDLVLYSIKKTNGNHFTVDDITNNLKTENTPVGKSTVYRYINILVDEGIIKKCPVNDGASMCYQYLSEHINCINHYHLICTSCDKIFHAENKILEPLINKLSNQYEFKLDNVKTILYGLCKNCSIK